MTAASCIWQLGEDANTPQGRNGPSDLEIYFKQAPERIFSADEILMIGGSLRNNNLAFIYLDEDVPANIVVHTSPVFLEDITDAVSSGRISLEGLSKVHSHGGSSQSRTVQQSDASFRVSTGHDWWLLTHMDAQNNPYGMTERCGDQLPGDDACDLAFLTSVSVPNVQTPTYLSWDPLDGLGAPLFVWDDLAKRYALLAIFDRWTGVDLAPHNHEDGWRYFGDLNDGNPFHDHATRLRSILDEDFERTFGADEDGDGIPDSWDNCPPSYCEENDLSPSLCFNPDQADSLGTGVGDRCRGCLDGMAYGVLGSRNSNPDVEQAFGALEQADICDPVPLMRPSVETHQVIRGQMPAQTTFGLGDHEVMRFSAAPIVGRGGWTEGFEEKIGFRFCGCYDQNGERQPHGACARNDGACSPTAAHSGVDGWDKTEVDYLASTGTEVVPEDGGAPHTFFPASREAAGLQHRWRSPLSMFRWRWYKEASEGRIASEEVSQSWSGHQTPPVWSTTSYTGVYGFFATAVLDDGAVRSAYEKDQAWGKKLRVSLTLQELPKWGPPADPNQYFLYDPLARCDLRRCLLPIIWPDYPEPLGPHFSREGLMMQRSDYQPMLRINFQEAFDVSDLVTEAFKELVATSPQTRLFLPAVEPGGLRDALNVTKLGVVLDQHVPMTPRVVVGNAEVDLAELSLSLPLHFSEDAEMVYLATENSILSIDPGSTNSQMLVRYDLGSGLVHTLQPPELLDSDIPLALTYDARRQIAYILDTSNDGMARLIRFPLDSSEAAVIWSVPFEGRYEIYALSLDELGTALYLTVADDEAHRSWMIDPRDGSFHGSVGGDELLLDLPAMGVHAPFLSLLEGGEQLTTRSLIPQLFVEELECTEL